MATASPDATASSVGPLQWPEWQRLLLSEPLPLALVDLDAFDRNVRQVAALVRAARPSLTLRPASKSLRVPALLRRVLQQGPPFQGVMTFTAQETRYLHQSGFEDFLLAYPTLQPRDLVALRELHGDGGRVRLVVDGVGGIRAASAAMAGLQQPLELVVELDCSLRLLGGAIHLGVRRSPVRTPAQVLSLFQLAQELPGVTPGGVMAYEAQVAGLGDRNPFKRLLNPAAWAIRRLSVRHVRRLRRQVADRLAEAGFELPLFNGGGSGSLNWTTRESCLTEVTAGSAFYAPALFDHYRNIRFEPAAFFALPVVRAPDPGFATCLGGGYVASGGAGPDRLPQPWRPEGLQLLGGEGAGEVQTPIRLPEAGLLSPGDPVIFRHAKAGELMERFDQVALVQSGRIVERVRTYRGAGHAFL